MRRLFVRRCFAASFLLSLCAHAPGAPLPAPTVIQLALPAPGVEAQPIKLSVYLPPGYAGAGVSTRYRVLYANDGQDMPAVGLQTTLAHLYRTHAIVPLIVVAVDAPADRVSVYGLSDRASAHSLPGGSPIGPIGDKAHAYSAWFATALVPYIDVHYRTRHDTGSRTVLGWSLGALNAFNLAWQYPQVFGCVGAFSPSFWLAADRSNATTIQHTRLAQAMVDHGPRRPGLKFWFAAGTDEESADRDGDGVIDVIDDLRDFIDGYDGPDGFHQRGLRQLGYRVAEVGGHRSTRNADVVLYVLPGGKHQQASWKQMLPVFLRWAFAPEKP